MDIERYVEIRRTSDILYDVQEVRKATENRLRTLPKEVYGVYPATLRRLEKMLTARLEELLDGVPVWDRYLKGLTGVGPRIAGAVIGRVAVKYVKADEGDEFTEVQKRYSIKRKDGVYVPVERGIEAFPNVSKFWKYFGLHTEDGTAPRRQRGRKLDTNEFLKMMVLGRFVPTVIKLAARWKGKARSGYYDLYLKMKEEYRVKYSAALKDHRLCPRWRECEQRLKKRAQRLGRKMKKPPCRAHIDAMAKRYVAKEFVKDLWVNWRRIEGLPVTPTYAQAKLGPKTPDGGSNAGQERDDTHGRVAGHLGSEAHSFGAGHEVIENQAKYAGQFHLEAQREDANRERGEKG